MSGPIGVIGAMEVEVEALLSIAQIEKTEERASMRFHQGTLAGVPVVVVQCGVGKVNAALCAQTLIDRYAPRAVLNLGVAGGLGPVKIGEVVLATHCVQHDFDPTPLGDPLATLNMPPDGRPVRELPCDQALSEKLAAGAQGLYGKVHRGPIATGDQFIADNGKAQALYAAFGALACEMEGGAIAHACYLNGVPCAVLRTISDNGNDDASVDFPTFARDSALKAQRLLSQTIGAL